MVGSPCFETQHAFGSTAASIQSFVFSDTVPMALSDRLDQGPISRPLIPRAGTGDFLRNTPGAVVCKQIDRFSSSVQSRFVRRAITHPQCPLSHGGHYRSPSTRGSAATPDAYRADGSGRATPPFNPRSSTSTGILPRLRFTSSWRMSIMSVRRGRKRSSCSGPRDLGFIHPKLQACEPKPTKSCRDGPQKTRFRKQNQGVESFSSRTI